MQNRSLIFAPFPAQNSSCRHVTPTMRLYLPRVEARLRGITALWFCLKKGHLHTIPCNEQEWDKELAYNRHFTQYIDKSYINQRYTHRSVYRTKIKEDNPTARSLIVPTGLHYWSTRKETTQRTRSSSSSHLSSVASSALVSSAPATVLEVFVSHGASAISHPHDQDYLSL